MKGKDLEMHKMVYSFGAGKAEGSSALIDLLGGKGANLAEMCNLGLPIPPGFTITTEVCSAYYKEGEKLSKKLKSDVISAILEIESAVGKSFGNPKNALLVSVRSGARASMPGMMDTVLNLGLNDATVEGIIEKTSDARFALDSYRRFIQMYGDVVLGINGQDFENLLERYKEENAYFLDTDMTVKDWWYLIDSYKDLVLHSAGNPFPQDPHVQLWGAINAVLDSWMNPRAITYRKLHNIPQDCGTAVNIQSMVFGNMGEDCATGVAFTRNPSTGEKAIYGEFLVNAQGEDVVAGIRTPRSLSYNDCASDAQKKESMESVFPKVYSELFNIMQQLETHYCDMQDIEFTVEKGKLWILQTRAGKRTAKAALKIAVDLVKEGLINKPDAILRIDPISLDQLLHPALDPEAPRLVIAQGLPASPGAAVGRVVFTADQAEDMAAKGESVILVRAETSPEDIHGMHAAKGIVTSRGGMTSHAAVVARGMGRPCITGASALKIDSVNRIISIDGKTITEQDIITVDGSRGEILKGEIGTIPPDLTGDFGTLMNWADSYRHLRIRANAETPKDSLVSLGFGAEGIGLCRTEHMFFESDRIIAMREMILAHTLEERRTAIQKLLPMQREDFLELFRIMEGRPITIRLLDPPLHEFLPRSESEISELAESTGVTQELLRARAADLHESNPMLGHRGCRLGISYPEIYEMQARAVFLAATDAIADGLVVKPEIMIPLVMTKREVEIIGDLVQKVAKTVEIETKILVSYNLGSMIELPAAALRADEIAERAEFFSFGTNDLTQTTLGLSRDDSASFASCYEEEGIFPHDPFAQLDQKVIGELIRIAVQRGREKRENIKLGICGEHGGDPKSIKFFNDIGLQYVSCSPYRVPIARLAAAQAALQTRK